MKVASPPTAPIDSDVYLVLDDFGEFGIAYRETDVSQADEKAVIENMLTGQYARPERIISFNAAEGWARDGLSVLFFSNRLGCLLPRGHHLTSLGASQSVRDGLGPLAPSGRQVLGFHLGLCKGTGCFARSGNRHKGL